MGDPEGAALDNVAANHREANELFLGVLGIFDFTLIEMGAESVKWR